MPLFLFLGLLLVNAEKEEEKKIYYFDSPSLFLQKHFYVFASCVSNSFFFFFEETFPYFKRKHIGLLLFLNRAALSPRDWQQDRSAVGSCDSEQHFPVGSSIVFWNRNHSLCDFKL